MWKRAKRPLNFYRPGRRFMSPYRKRYLSTHRPWGRKGAFGYTKYKRYPYTRNWRNRYIK